MYQSAKYICVLCLVVALSVIGCSYESATLLLAATVDRGRKRKAPGL